MVSSIIRPSLVRPGCSHKSRSIPGTAANFSSLRINAKVHSSTRFTAKNHTVTSYLKGKYILAAAVAMCHEPEDFL